MPEVVLRIPKSDTCCRNCSKVATTPFPYSEESDKRARIFEASEDRLELSIMGDASMNLVKAVGRDNPRQSWEKRRMVSGQAGSRGKDL